MIRQVEKGEVISIGGNYKDERGGRTQKEIKLFSSPSSSSRVLLHLCCLCKEEAWPCLPLCSTTFLSHPFSETKNSELRSSSSFLFSSLLFSSLLCSALLYLTLRSFYLPSSVPPFLSPFLFIPSFLSSHLQDRSCCYIHPIGSPSPSLPST